MEDHASTEPPAPGMALVAAAGRKSFGKASRSSWDTAAAAAAAVVALDDVILEEEADAASPATERKATSFGKASVLSPEASPLTHGESRTASSSSSCCIGDAGTRADEEEEEETVDEEGATGALLGCRRVAAGRILSGLSSDRLGEESLTR